LKDVAGLNQPTVDVEAIAEQARAEVARQDQRQPGQLWRGIAVDTSGLGHAGG
jgi:hypothetical protein